jgi:hypothetical protein
MTTATAPALRSSVPVADLGDELAAGRSYPVRDFRVKLNHATASAHLEACRVFWIDAAIGYTALAEKGCRESAGDAREAMAKAAYFGRKTIGR